MRILLFHAVFGFVAVLADGDLVKLFRLAMMKAGCEDKQAYSDMGISQSQFSKQMVGLEPPRFLSRIWKIQNREVVKWFAFLVGIRAGGLPREVKRGVPMTLAMMAHRRMQKASLDTKRQLSDRKEQAS